MRKVFRLSVFLGVLAWIVVPARAQQPGSYGPGRGLDSLTLLRLKCVHREINATPEQARKLDALCDEFLKKGQEEAERVREIPKQDRRAKLLEMQRTRQEDRRKGVAAILKPEQVKRFDQIEIQQRSINAFEIPRVQERLKLTEGQKVQVQEINREMMDSIADLTRRAVRSDDIRKDAAELVRQVFPLRAQALAKCVAMLTDEQKATWNDLYGEPFVIVIE
jgi:hypothetical protein